MRKTTFLTTIMIITIILISGCRGGSGGKDQGDSNFMTGSQGVEINFMTGNPPSIIYDGDTFDLALELKNKGVSRTIVNYFFTGFDPNILVVQNLQGAVTFTDAKDQFNGDGGYEVVQTAGAVNLPDGTDSYNTQIRAIACYEYRTKADPKVCIDPEPNRGSENDVCQVTSVSAGTQGAPLAVTSVLEEAQPNKARFKITIQNVGGGSLLDPNHVSDCMDPRYSITYYDRVEVVDVRLANGPSLQCEPDNPIKLNGGVGYFYCKVEGLTGSSAYDTVLNVDLRYGYKTTTTASVQIRSNR